MGRKHTRIGQKRENEFLAIFSVNNDLTLENENGCFITEKFMFHGPTFCKRAPKSFEKKLYVTEMLYLCIK